MTIQIALRISEELAASVDQLCTADGGMISRSEFLRIAIEKHVSDRKRTLVDAQIVASYSAQPPAPAIDEWGDLAKQQDWLNYDNARALEAEDGGW